MAFKQKSSGNEIYYVIQDGDGVLQPEDHPSNHGLSEEDAAIEWVVSEGTNYQGATGSESLANGNSNVSITEKIIQVKKESMQPRKRKAALQASNDTSSQPSTSSAPGTSNIRTFVVEDQESDDGEGSSSQPKDDSQPKAKRQPRSIVWTDEAVEKLLKLLEAAYPHMSSLPPPKRAELWHCVEQDMKPFAYSGIECHIKFTKLKTTYKKLKSENPKARRYWKHYKAVGRVLGEDDDTQMQLPGAEAKKSVEPANVASRLRTDEASLSRFDELIKAKKDILAEVRRHGDIIRQHVSETVEFNSRREQRELDTLELLKNIHEQEKTKLKFLGTLLDKLWDGCRCIDVSKTSMFFLNCRFLEKTVDLLPVILISRLLDH